MFFKRSRLKHGQLLGLLTFDHVRLFSVCFTI